MGLRELLILILILAIVGVILRGLFVALSSRRSQLRMRLDKNIPQYDPDELIRSELPNGGARMVERSFAQVLQQNSEFSSNERRKAGKSDHAIPVLMDTVGDDDDDDLSTPRQSSVASARNAARQKHLLGQRSAPIVQKPVHRPIDRLAAMAQNNPTITSDPVKIQESHATEHENDEDFYDDPLDRHVFSESDDLDEQEAEDFEDDADSDDYDEDYDDERGLDEFDDTPSEQSVDDDDDYDEDDDLDDDLDESPSEDSVDPDDDSEEDYDDDDFEDDLDDAEEGSAARAAESPSDFDDDDYDEDEDLYEKKAYDDHGSWEDEDDAEDEEVSLEPEEFDAVYGDLEDEEPVSAQQDAKSYDDADDGWDDDIEPQPVPEESGPRRWLKWAGNKLSGRGASSNEPVRERDFHGAERAEPVLGLEGFDEDLSPPRAAKPAPVPRSANSAMDKSHQAQLSFDDEEDDFEEEAETPEYIEEKRKQAPPRAQALQSTGTKAAEASAATTTEATVLQDYSEVMVINVVAKPEREFYGVDLLQALLGSGLRFGDMSIFHRHFDQDPSSPVLFSVANMMNPGTFDLNQINDFATRGVCFFMTLPNVANSMQAFERMLDAAQQLRMALDGDLKDDNRSVMTAQTIEHYRQRVRDFDLRQLRQPK